MLSSVHPSTCHRVEAAGLYFGHRCWVPDEPGRSKEPAAASAEREKFYLKGRESVLQRELDFLSGDGQRFLGHCSHHNLATAKGQRLVLPQHAAGLSKVQWVLE